MQGIKTLLTSLFGCFSQKRAFAYGRSRPAFVLLPPPGHQPFSDVELKQCRDVLSPLGYTVIRKPEDNGIQIYRQEDWQEQRRAEELVLQTLKQDA